MSNLVNNRMAATQSINRKIEKSRNARNGFTVLELLVASLLLGMLMTILTMVFNQSSIAWRTGTAGVASMGKVREKIADVRAKADNVYIWDKEAYCVSSVFNKDGELQTFDAYLPQAKDKSVGTKHSTWVPEIPSDDADKGDLDVKDIAKSKGLSGRFDGNENSGNNYIVNVKSAGPNREFGDAYEYDDIWSFPDDPNEW